MRAAIMSRGIIDRQIEKGRSTPEKKAEILCRIHPTADFADLKDVDLIVEAVFEDRAVKAEATQEGLRRDAEGGGVRLEHLDLPITGLAEASDRPESFIGVHFFSPVDRMGLVEIIRGKQTERPRARHGDGLRPEDQEDAHRRERQPRLLHLALRRHLPGRRHGDAERRHPSRDDRECRRAWPACRWARWS